MYFRCSFRNNPEVNKSQPYYRLIESYRNIHDRVCHRTLLPIGFTKLTGDQLARIQHHLNARANGKPELFEETDKEIIPWVEQYWTELIEKKKIDSPEKRRRMIDTDTMRHKEVKEIGAEWLGYQALEQLKLGEFLKTCLWSEEKIKLTLTQIISRAVYPASELCTSRRIKENSAICEITQYPVEKITKDKLYKNALDLYGIKDSLERFLSHRTNELFDLQDKIILYDLTNTYFEGEKKNSKLAQYGRSKEKRSDCKLIVLALVINVEGFIKYSNVFEGNMSDSKTVPAIINQLRDATSQSAQRALVVLDAGIATEENLAILQAKGYDYLCVSRSSLKDYKNVEGSEVTEIYTKKNVALSVQRVCSDNTTDYYLRVKSAGKREKEESMKNVFEYRFEEGIEKIKAGLSKKNTIKKYDKINQRIGRVQEKYPSVAKYYDVQVAQNENGTATEITYTKNQTKHEASLHRLGVYFIRTNLDLKEEQLIWDTYNTIREIESSFRALKSEVDLRPIYHKTDNGTLAHLHLALLAYWLVNTIRYQLKQKGITHSWTEIVRIANTQKVVTTTGQNQLDETICVRRCSEPSANLKTLYMALDYHFYPFTKRKSVVLNSEFQKTKNQHSQGFLSG